MNPVTVVNVHAVVDVAEDKDHTGRRILCLPDNGVQTLWRSFDVLVLLHVFEQNNPELFKYQIHDGNAAGHVMNIQHKFLHPIAM